MVKMAKMVKIVVKRVVKMVKRVVEMVQIVVQMVEIVVERSREMGTLERKESCRGQREGNDGGFWVVGFSQFQRECRT